MAEPRNPGAGRSTSQAAFSEITKQVARRNEEAQKAARKARTRREQQQLAWRRAGDRH